MNVCDSVYAYVFKAGRQYRTVLLYDNLTLSLLHVTIPDKAPQNQHRVCARVCAYMRFFHYVNQSAAFAPLW